MTARPNRNEYCRLDPWVSNALLQLLKKRELQAGMRGAASSGTALILQMVRAKNTGRVVMAQYPVADLSAAYARLVSDDFPPAGEFVAYLIVASRAVLADADRRGVPYLTAWRSSTGHHAAEVLHVPRSLFADVEENAR